MKRAIFPILSAFRRFLRTLGIARILIRFPFVSRVFWFAYGYLRPRDVSMVNVRDFDFKLYVDPRDTALGCTLLMLGRFDPLTSRVFSSLLREGMTVVDIGAQVGYYTVLAARCVGASGRVYAFEPEVDNFNLLCKNLSVNNLEKVVAVRKALLDRSGPHRFYLAAESLGRHGIYKQDDSVEEIAVDTITLDEFFSGTEEWPQVIKLDAEGAEPLILKGMKGVIAGASRLALFTELFLPNLQAGGHSPEAYLAELVSSGFVLHLLDEDQECVTQMGPNNLIEICRTRPGPVRNVLCLKGWDL